MAINDDFFFNDLCRGIFRIGYEFVLTTEAVLVFNSNQHARGYPIEVLNTLYITLYYLCIILPQCPSHRERSSCSLIHDVVYVTYTERWLDGTTIYVLWSGFTLTLSVWMTSLNLYVHVFKSVSPSAQWIWFEWLLFWHS